MKDYTKKCHTWLNDNHVIVYNSTFEYKGVLFSIEKKGTKFYCVSSSGDKYPASAVKVIAVYWACTAS